jgi:hypothetical protein
VLAAVRATGMENSLTRRSVAEADD